jgi:hypothetical protein
MYAFALVSHAPAVPEARATRISLDSDFLCRPQALIRGLALLGEVSLALQAQVATSCGGNPVFVSHTEIAIVVSTRFQRQREACRASGS